MAHLFILHEYPLTTIHTAIVRARYVDVHLLFPINPRFLTSITLLTCPSNESITCVTSCLSDFCESYISVWWVTLLPLTLSHLLQLSAPLTSLTSFILCVTSPTHIHGLLVTLFPSSQNLFLSFPEYQSNEPSIALSVCEPPPRYQTRQWHCSFALLLLYQSFATKSVIGLSLNRGHSDFLPHCERVLIYYLCSLGPYIGSGHLHFLNLMSTSPPFIDTTPNHTTRTSTDYFIAPTLHSLNPTSTNNRQSHHHTYNYMSSHTHTQFNSLDTPQNIMLIAPHMRANNTLRQTIYAPTITQAGNTWILPTYT